MSLQVKLYLRESEERMRLRDKVAIVTGGSRGIGKAIALDFAREGAMVVVGARTEAVGRLPGTIYETVEEIREIGGQAIAVKCDVSNEEDVEALVKRALEEFGQIDILINNAAVAYYRLLAEIPVRHWDLVMKVNLRGPFLCIGAVLPMMMARKKGSIVNISSSAAQDVFSRVVKPDGTRPFTGCAYGSSKAALERMTVGLAEEVREHNIAVNALKPAKPTYSPGLAGWFPEVDESAFISADLFMTKAALLLATQDAGGITGGVFFDDELCHDYSLV